MKSRPLDLNSHRLAVCLGPGGVGKTTISAALAVDAAARGRAVDVMTIDPAPRLLDALGLSAGDPGPHYVELDGTSPRWARGNQRARLRAFRLDAKTTFDSIVARNAPSQAARDAIIQNRIYRNLSHALAGVADYMAMEKLLELSSDPATDLVVVDTPPASEAVDFLDAPRRMLELLNSRAITLLGASGGLLRSQLRIVDLAARAVLAAFDRITRLNLLGEVQSFVQSFAGMYQGFAERAERASLLLRTRETAVVVVTSAEQARVEQARDFVDTLKTAGLRVSAIVVNRVMNELPPFEEVQRAKISPSLKRKLKQNLENLAALKEREKISIDALHAMLPEEAELILSPDLGREPRAISDFAELARNFRALD